MRTFFIIPVLAFLLVKQNAYSQSNWQHQGPYSYNQQTGDNFVSGRLDVICPDPLYGTLGNQTIYAGSSSGGLWVTYDAGQSWSVIPGDQAQDFPHYGGVTAIAVGQGSPYQSVYIGDCSVVTGSSGVYIYTPNNQTWQGTGSLGLNQPFYIRNIQVHPANNQIVFTCTSQGLFRSSNGGTSWSLVQTGDVKNVAFLPRTGGSGQYAYYVYASALDHFYASQDDGITFSAVTAMENLFTGHLQLLPNICYTPSASNPGDHYIYLYAYGLTTSNATHYVIYRFTYNSTSNTESSSQLISYTNDVSGGPVPDRLTVTANDQVVYCGGGFAKIYNAVTNTMSNFSSPPHVDQHAMYFHKATNSMFLGCDGGFYFNTYTPQNNPDNGVGTNNLVRRNDGLHISQINGFSGSENSPDIFLTGEQDNKGFYSSSSTQLTFASWGGENTGGLFDKFSATRSIVRQSSYNGNIGVYNSIPSGANQAYDMSQTLYMTPDPASFCNSNVYNLSMGADFASNSMFQDPNRPDRIFYGTDAALMEYCPTATSNPFIMKFRPSVIFGTGGPLDIAIYDQVATAMGFSRADKNAMYFSITSRYFPPNSVAAAQVFRFIGPDIDDSWVDHNENTSNWARITPDFTTTGIVNVPLSATQVYQVFYPGLVVSDWNPDKAWLAVRDFPEITGNAPVKVLQYNNGTWTNFSTGIPANEVPMSMVYEQGTNDLVYLGTNRGVYYRDATMSSWQPYMTNLPRIGMSQLQINYTENTLRAGTYGHGVWKTALQCPSSAPITETGTISADKFDETGSYITAQNLTISAGDVKFRAADYIDLLPDFIVTGSSSTKFFAFIHECDESGNTFRVGESSGVNPATPLASVLENIPMNEIQVMPNPNNGQFIIRRQLLEGSVESAADIFIFDMMGRIVSSFENSSEPFLEIDMRTEAKGIYLVKCIIDGRISNVKVINQ